MSAINEAYARIDYSYLKQLETRLQAVEEEIDEMNEDLDSINDEDVKGSNKRIITKRISQKDNKPSGKVTFSPAFPERPTVTATVADNSGVARTVVITELNREYVKYSVFKHPGQKADASFSIHMIIVGKKK